MVRRSFLIVSTAILMGLFLWGCPKKAPEIVPEKPPYENPIVKILNGFSSVETLQAKVSIRIETVRDGERMNIYLSGLILYQRPDHLRILGYHPLGMGVFDALYINGQFFILSPLQKRAYTGDASEFENQMEKADVQVFLQKPEGSDIPNRIRIEVKEKESSAELRLRDIQVNNSLSENSFQWVVPEGIDVRPLRQFLKGTKIR